MAGISDSHSAMSRIGMKNKTCCIGLTIQSPRLIPASRTLTQDSGFLHLPQRHHSVRGAAGRETAERAATRPQSGESQLALRFRVCGIPSRHLQMIENPLNEVLGRDVFGFGLVRDGQAMAEHVVADGL